MQAALHMKQDTLHQYRDKKELPFLSPISDLPIPKTICIGDNRAWLKNDVNFSVGRAMYNNISNSCEATISRVSANFPGVSSNISIFDDILAVTAENTVYAYERGEISVWRVVIWNANDI